MAPLFLYVCGTVRHASWAKVLCAAWVWAAEGQRVSGGQGRGDMYKQTEAGTRNAMSGRDDDQRAMH